MAERQHGGQTAGAGSGGGERRDPALDEAVVAAQSLLDLRACEDHHSPSANSSHQMESGDAVDSPLATGNTISNAQTAMTVM